MKKILITTFISAMCLSSFSQKHYTDIVYLKNGGNIRGVIYEQVPLKYLKISTTNGDTLIFNNEEIDSLAKEPVRKIKIKSEQPKLKTGYRALVEMGGTAGSSGGLSCFKISVVNSYIFNPCFSMGIGTGIIINSLSGSVFSTYNYLSNRISIPLYLDTRVNINDKRFSPFISASVGNSFGVDDKNFENRQDNYVTLNGIFLGAYLGFSYIITKRSFANFSMGYEKYECKLTPEFYPYNEKNNFFKGFNIRIGLAF